MKTIWIGWVIEVNGKWQENHENYNRKGEVNGFDTSDALAMLGTVVLNVVHVLHK